MRRVIVIGGGIIGLSTTVRLLQAGLSVTLVDAPSAAASWGNAGHIAIEQVEPLASWPVIRSAPRRLFGAGGALSLPISQLSRWLPFALQMAAASHPERVEQGRAALRSLLTPALPAWQRLTRDIDARSLLRETGHFIVWESPATAAAGLASWRSTDIGTATFHECDANERRLLTSLMKQPPAGAIRFDNTGQIADLPKLCEALQKSISARGGILVNAKVVHLQNESGSVAVALEDGKRLHADLAVISAGVRSRELIERLNHRVPLIAERGYHIQMAHTGWPDVPPVVFEDRSMIVTRFDSGLRAASFVEFGSPDAPPDARKWQRLRHHVAALGLPFDSTAREWMGARPTLPDYLPAMGQLPDAPNVYYAFGHQHLGLTLAAITGELMAQQVTQTQTAVNLAPFDIRRFSR